MRITIETKTHRGFYIRVSRLEPHRAKRIWLKYHFK